MEVFAEILLSTVIAFASSASDIIARNSWRFLSENVRSKVSKDDLTHDILFLLLLNTWFLIGIQWLSLLWKLWLAAPVNWIVLGYIVVGIMIWGGFARLVAYDSHEIRRNPFRKNFYKFFPILHAIIAGCISFYIAD